MITDRVALGIGDLERQDVEAGREAAFGRGSPDSFRREADGVRWKFTRDLCLADMRGIAGHFQITPYLKTGAADFATPKQVF